MFPFPGTPDYLKMWGIPDDRAWERAHQYYLNTFRDKGYSDIQESQPASLEELECTF
jgi:anaerobic magnesium-protoporphyrin IX monomethyl ester cyclase